MDTTVVIIIGYQHEVSPTSTRSTLFIKWGPGNRITKSHKSQLFLGRGGVGMPRQRVTFTGFCSVSIPSCATVDSNRSFVEPSAHLIVYIFEHSDSVNMKSPNLYSNIYPTRCNITHFVYIWKLLYMFRVVSPPIIRSTHTCIYSIWCLSNR